MLRTKAKVRAPVRSGVFSLTLLFAAFGPRSYIVRVSLAPYILNAVLAYLLGSIPSGFLIGKLRGVDVRTSGSGNIGATNVMRVLGRPAGIVVLVLDGLKGWAAAVLVAGFVVRSVYPSAGPLAREWLQIEAGFLAILGHNYTCWLRFKGGKGIATSAGVLAALVPWALVCVLVLWAVVLVLTRYVSLASICGSAALPLATWLLHYSAALIGTTTVMTVMAIYKHKANIQRLMRGTENRFGAKPNKAEKRP